MKEPLRIEELSKMIPGGSNKHTVIRAMVFVGILSSQQQAAQAQQEIIAVR